MPRNVCKYDLRYEIRRGYLYANISAQDIDLESATASLRDAIERCRSSHHDRLMIHRDVPATLSNADTSILAEEVANYRLVKIALVDTRP